MCSTPPRSPAISSCAARSDGETVLALDGREYALTPEMCVIADDNGVESIAGIMGGEHSGCDENDHRRADRIGAVGAAQHRPHRPHARHHHRCALSLRARRRSGVHGSRAGARDQDGARFLRRHADARPRSSAMPATSRRSSSSRLPEVKRLTGLDVPRRRKPRHPVAARLRVEGFRRCRRRRGAVLAAGHRRQGRSGRGGHAHPWRRQHRAAAARPATTPSTARS